MHDTTITNNMEIIKTQKGEALIWQGSKFTLNRTMAGGKKYWRYGKRTCTARVTTEGGEVLQQTNGHNHPVDGVEAQVERVKHKLRKRAREVTPIPSIYNELTNGERDIDSYLTAIRHCVVSFDFNTVT